MIGIEPIGHTSPYQRIDLNAPKPREYPIDLLDEIGREALLNIQMREADRIWKITRQVAQGTNMPTPQEHSDAE